MSDEQNFPPLTDQLIDGTLPLYGKCVALFILGVMIFAVWFHVRVGIYGSYVALIQRPIHVLLFAFLSYVYDRRLINGPKHVSDIPVLLVRNILPAVLCVVVLRYQIINYDDLILRMGMAEPVDYFYGVALLLLILEATRRTVGWPVTIVAGVFLAYTFWGPYFPGPLRHQGFSLARVVGLHMSKPDGVFFMPTGTMADFVVIFIIFGVLLAESGAGTYLRDVSTLIVGRSVGGPAKLAVVSSGFLGTISGSCLANIATTGSFTIPLMKKTGYKPHFAGAVEAVASSGGQIMPPIMGASAFIMAATLGIPYLSVAKAALLPGSLYFIALIFGVHFVAKKSGMVPMPTDQMPPRRTALLNGAFLMMPVAVLLYFLIMGYSMMRVAFVLLVFTAGLCMTRRETRLTPRKLMIIMEKGIKNSMGVAVTVATAGIIVGSLLMTGLGFKISRVILEIAGGNLIAALFITMVISLILGMGMTTVAVYVILTSILSSGLTQLGANVLAVHFFVFYYGVISHITPPVALGSFAAAAIAGSDFWETSVESFKLGLVAFLVPFFFIMNPVLLFIGKPFQIALATVTAIIGTASLAAGLQGWFIDRTALFERLILITCSLLMLWPGFLTDGMGLGGMVLVAAIQHQRRKRLIPVSSST